MKFNKLSHDKPAGTAPAATTGYAKNSGLPLLSAGGIPRPAGVPGNLVVLDWAGCRAAVSYTFDDGQPSHIEHYAALQAAGVRMTFYVSSGLAGLPEFDKVWAGAVQDGHEIGNHTVHHCHADMTGSCFGSCAGSLDEEIDQCTEYITGHFGQAGVWTMAAPFGDIGWVGAAQSRFFLNRGVGGGSIAPCDDTNPFNLPSRMLSGGESAAELNRYINSAYKDGRWLIFLFHTIMPGSSNWYAPVDIAAITGNIHYAAALGNMWIDTVANIGAYWMGQKVLSVVRPVVSGSTRTWMWQLPAHFPAGKYLRVKVDGGTLRQGGDDLVWNDQGFYEAALDAGMLMLSG